MSLRSVARVAVGILLIPIAAIAGFLVAGLITFDSDDMEAVDRRRDAVIPNEKGVVVPRIFGDVTINGAVVRPGGKGVALATVRVSSGFAHFEVVTNAEGKFKVEKLPRGPVSIVAEAEHYIPELLQLSEAPAGEVILKLEPATDLWAGAPAAGPAGSLNIQVKFMNSEFRAPRLSIIALPVVGDGRESPLLPRIVEFDAVARAPLLIKDIPQGDYTIIAVPFGQSPDRRRALGEAPARITTDSAETLVLEVRVARVSGRVVGGGSGIARAAVRAIRRADVKPKDNSDSRIVETTEVELARAVTDDEGNFQIPGLPVGNVILETGASGFEIATKTVATDSQAAPIIIELRPSK